MAEEPEAKQITLRNIPADFHLEIKIQAVREGIPLQDLVLRLLKKGWRAEQVEKETGG